MRAVIAVLSLAVAAAGCTTNDQGSGSGRGTTPTPPTSTERFSGTVPVGGNSVHPFTVQLTGGELTLQLTSASPNVSVGIGVGTFTADACTLLTGGTVVAPAGAQPQLAGSVNAGSYCAMVFDPGNLQSPVTYSLTITHY